MADVTHLVARLGLADPKGVITKASEFVRVSTARLGEGGLGQGELCKGAACVELACMSLGVTVDAALVTRFSGVKEQVYCNAKAALQKILNVGTKASARDLCIQFGCARHDQSVRACLTAFKERYVRSLPPAQQAHVDFGRAVFLAAAFYLVARKNKVAVDRVKLLSPLGVTAAEFAQVSASMADLCHDLVGTEPRKRKAEEVPEEHRALIDRTGAADDDDDVASDSGDEVEDDGAVGGHRINPKKQRQREYEEWKAKMLADKPSASSGGGSSGTAGGGGAKEKKPQKEKMTEKKLRQAVLGFAAAAPLAAAAAAGAGKQAAAEPKQQQQQQAAAKQARGKGGSTPAKKVALASKNS